MIEMRWNCYYYWCLSSSMMYWRRPNTRHSVAELLCTVRRHESARPGAVCCHSPPDPALHTHTHTHTHTRADCFRSCSCFCAFIFSTILSQFMAFSALMLLVGRQEGHPACKKTEWWGAGVVVCLEWGADLHMAQLMPLPLIVSCFSKIQIGFTFLVPAYLGSPGQRAVKRVCVCVSVRL